MTNKELLARSLIPEKLSSASPARPLCVACGLHTTCREPFIKPYVPEHWTGKFLFVIETSEAGEEGYARSGVPLGSREQAQLKDILKLTHIERNDVAFVPVLRCRPVLTGSKKPKITSIRACRPFLVRTIKELNPYLTLAFGESAVKGICNTGSPGPIAKLRGRALTMPSTAINGTHETFLRVSATNKISSLLIDPHTKTRMIEDFRRTQTPETQYPAVDTPKGTMVGFDTEYGTNEAGVTNVYTLGIADTKRALSISPKYVQKIISTLQHATIVGHSVTVDIEALLRLKPKGLKIALENWLQGRKQRDTLLEAKLSDENRGLYGYKLESLAVALFNVKDWKQPTEALGPDSSKWPPHLRDERCRLDAWATLKIHDVLKDTVEGPSRLSHEIAMSLRRMYWAGVYIDAKKFATLRTKIYQERKDSFAVLRKYAKKFGLADEFTATDAQLREYVYGSKGVGLAVESRTKGGLPSVSVKILKEYAHKKAIQALLSFSKVDKLQTTYCDSLSKRFVKVGTQLWMPVSINPLAAKTGRRSSNAPNFQNWPKLIQQIVVSRFPKGCIADCDYNKLEPILGGWVANEPRLTEYFVKYPNGYIKIGEDFFKKTVEKNTKEYTSIKSLVLAILYNKKKWSFAEDMWITQGVKLDSDYEKHVDKCGQLLDRFLNELFPGVRRYHYAQEQAVLASGRVYNALGQCRRLPLPPEPPRSEKGAYTTYMRFKAHVINQSINYPIQSLAAAVVGCGLIDVERALLSEWNLTYVEYQTALMEKRWPNIPLLAVEVHDSLVLDVPKGKEKKTREIIQEVMCKPPSLVAVLPELFDSNVKLSVDINIGPCWGTKT